MKNARLLILCGLAILTSVFVPAGSAVTPLWTQAATTSGELSGVTISADGSTIAAYGDQVIVLDRDGRKLWSAWSGTYLVLSRDGKYLLTSRQQIVRMISGSGTMLWDTSLDVPVKDISMTPDASLIAAGGGSRVRIMSASGAGLRQNTSILVNHLRLFPDGDQIAVTSKNGVMISNLTLLSDRADTNMSQDLLEVAADGSSIVTVTNNRVRLYSRDGILQWQRSLPGGNALAFAWSRDGSTIVIGRDDNTLEVLDGRGTLLWNARATYWITSVAVSDDGNTIAAGSMDRNLSLYDRTGAQLGLFTAKNPIRARSVAVSGDGSLIVAVDASAVYGFSRSQFTRPLTTDITTTAAPVPVTTTVTITTMAATSPLSVPPASQPTQAPLLPAMPIAVLVLILVLRSRRS